MDSMHTALKASHHVAMWLCTDKHHASSTKWPRLSSGEQCGPSLLHMSSEMLPLLFPTKVLYDSHLQVKSCL